MEEERQAAYESATRKELNIASASASSDRRIDELKKEKEEKQRRLMELERKEQDRLLAREERMLILSRN